jgi:iron complex transport system substrate-binding protein
VVPVERGTLASVYGTIRTLGTATQTADRAAALIARLQARLDAVRAASARHPRRKVLVIVGRRLGMLSDLIAVGRDSYLSDIITIAGGANVLDDPSLPAYPRISMETVIRLAPDVIIDAADMGDTPEELARRKIATEALWRGQTLLAARNGAVHAATTEAFTVPGPRVVDVAETLAAWLNAVGGQPGEGGHR